MFAVLFSIVVQFIITGIAPVTDNRLLVTEFSRNSFFPYNTSVADSLAILLILKM